MDTNFSTIKNAFEDAGIDVQHAHYSFTAYSLNTSLSFKFENIREFALFLNLDEVADSGKIEHINALIADAGLDPATFFYVNFYKPKVAEL